MATPYLFAMDLGALTVTPSAGSHASYPVSNLYNGLQSYVWQSGGTAANQYINIDLGSAIAVEYLMVHNHNWLVSALGSGTTISLEYDVNDNGAYSALAAVEDETLQTLATSGALWGVHFGTSYTKRYWRISFYKASALSAAPYAGQIFLSNGFELNPAYDFNYIIGDQEFQTSRARSLAGIERASQWHTGWNTAELSFRIQDSTFGNNMRSFMDKVRGGLRPFYFYDHAGYMWLMKLADDYMPVTIPAYGISTLQRMKMVGQYADTGSTYGTMTFR